MLTCLVTWTVPKLQWQTFVQHLMAQSSVATTCYTVLRVLLELWPIGSVRKQNALPTINFLALACHGQPPRTSVRVVHAPHREHCSGNMDPTLAGLLGVSRLIIFFTMKKGRLRCMIQLASLTPVWCSMLRFTSTDLWTSTRPMHNVMVASQVDAQKTAKLQRTN